jgi:hypothetical protein
MPKWYIFQCYWNDFKRRVQRLLCRKMVQYHRCHFTKRLQTLWRRKIFDQNRIDQCKPMPNMPTRILSRHRWAKVLFSVCSWTAPKHPRSNNMQSMPRQLVFQQSQTSGMPNLWHNREGRPGRHVLQQVRGRHVHEHYNPSKRTQRRKHDTHKPNL